jgi:hypothetical protein
MLEKVHFSPISLFAILNYMKLKTNMPTLQNKDGVGNKKLEMIRMKGLDCIN